MRRTIALFLIVALSCLSMSAFAQTTDDSIDTKKQQFINMGDQLIDGKLMVPTQETFTKRHKTEFRGKLELFRNFQKQTQTSTLDDALDQ